MNYLSLTSVYEKWTFVPKMEENQWDSEACLYHAKANASAIDFPSELWAIDLLWSPHNYCKIKIRRHKPINANQSQKKGLNHNLDSFIWIWAFWRELPGLHKSLFHKRLILDSYQWLEVASPSADSFFHRRIKTVSRSLFHIRKKKKFCHKATLSSHG